MSKCKVCNALFTRVYLMQKTCLNPPCIIKYSKAEKEKKSQKEWKDRKKQLSITSKSYSQLKREAKTVFQKYCRIRDNNLPCISCGKKESNQWDGGHYRKAEVYSGVIFDERNVNKQCSRPCNKDLHGNEVQYRIGLIAKIGLKEVEELEELANRTRYTKWTRGQLNSIVEEYKLKIKNYERINS